MRHTAVRLVDRLYRIVDRLKILHLAEKRQRVSLIVETQTAVQVCDARNAQRAAKILEVLIIGDLPKIDAVAPAVDEHRPVFEPQQVTRVVEHVVIGQVLGIRTAVHSVRQIAKLRSHLQTAIG